MKKSILISLVAMLAIALFAVSASAQLTITSPTLGGTSAEAGTNTSATVTITNTGNSTLSGISMSHTADSKFAIGFTGAPTSLAAGASASVTVSGFLHRDLNAINSAFDDAAQSIGNVIVSASGNVSASNTLNMQIKNQLEIKKVYITVNGEDEHSLDDGDDLKDLKPGDKLEVRVEVESNFDEDDDIDLEDIDVVMDIDSDFDTGDEEDTIDSLSGEDQDSITFDDMEVEDEASGDYTLTITVKGHRDDTSVGSGEHGQEVKIDLDVERESHEIAFRTASLSPSKVPYGKNTFDAKLKVVNIGKSNEDEVVLEVSVPALGITERKENIEIDKSDELSRTITVTLPAGTKPGSYVVEVRSYWNTDIESDMRTLTLELEAAPTTTTATTTTQPVVTTPPTTTTTPTTTTVTSKAKSSSSFLDSTAGIATLTLGVIAAIVILIFLVTMLMKKPAQ